MKKISDLSLGQEADAGSAFGGVLEAKLLSLPEIECVAGGEGTGTCGPGTPSYGSSGGSFVQAGGQFQQTGGSYNMRCTPAPNGSGAL
ncbi:hypothetical protein H5407_00525 [Mitsuaria sp. WAJ17]|uniref:hypothetical protein n=1 Tax=Mitsuaria sp. WAJ17 TaxID=2761452 RepID=UPI00160156DB|nr:hypothetical protein [Mitsuaria sp. WAJ17]MBB2483703.1 hypothetical protein [Mitsuaria sp. WAJ17]